MGGGGRGGGGVGGGGGGGGVGGGVGEGDVDRLERGALLLDELLQDAPAELLLGRILLAVVHQRLAEMPDNRPLRHLFPTKKNKLFGWSR